MTPPSPTTVDEAPEWFTAALAATAEQGTTMVERAAISYRAWGAAEHGEGLSWCTAVPRTHVGGTTSVTLRLAGLYGDRIEGAIAIDSPARELTTENLAAREKRAFGPLQT